MTELNHVTNNGQCLRELLGWQFDNSVRLPLAAFVLAFFLQYELLFIVEIFTRGRPTNLVCQCFDIKNRSPRNGLINTFSRSRGVVIVGDRYARIFQALEPLCISRK